MTKVKVNRIACHRESAHEFALRMFIKYHLLKCLLAMPGGWRVYGSDGKFDVVRIESNYGKTERFITLNGRVIDREDFELWCARTTP